MSDGYSLSQRQAGLCRAVAILFSIAALVRAAAILGPLVFAAPPRLEVTCPAGHCVTAQRPDLLLPAAERDAVTASPAAAARLTAYVARPPVRAGLAAIDLAQGAPFVALMLCVALAVRRLGARGADDLARALPWLWRASIAALADVFVSPLSDSLRAMLLFPATPSGPSWYLAVDFGRFLTGVLLALAALIVSWALAAGSRARRDLADFV